jgi:hypothetical protein
VRVVSAALIRDSVRTLVALLVLVAPRLARAQDQFEIQVYDAETAAPAETGVELHLNFVADGTAATNHLTHFAMEPHLGLARWCEIGFYLQAAALPDGELDFAGAKLRGKVRLPRRLAHDLIGLALNVELSYVPARYEPNVYGSELRPIADLRWRRLYAAVNPILSIDLGGPLAGRPQMEPAAKIAVSLVENVAIGAEYYGALGPINGPLPGAQQVHRLFGALDFSHRGPSVAIDLNLGVGYGLVAGDRWIAKAIVGIAPR